MRDSIYGKVEVRMIRVNDVEFYNALWYNIKNEIKGQKVQQCMTYRFHKNVVQKCPNTLHHHTPQNTPIDCPLAEFGVI